MHVIKSTGWIIIQSAFNPRAVNQTGIMDRVAVLAEGTFYEITNDKIDMDGVGSQRNQIPSPADTVNDGTWERNVNLRNKEIIEEAVRYMRWLAYLPYMHQLYMRF